MRKGSLLILAVLLFVLHRLGVALSAGDFLYPLEPSELKHTQIAWDIFTGRWAERSLRAYVTNSGSVHHGSYSTVAAVYAIVGPALGWGLLSVRAVPLLFWSLALLLWGETLRRLFGTASALLAMLGLTLVPTIYLGFQVTMLGSHSEAVLPLAASVAAWIAWRQGSRPRLLAAVWGATLGYGLSFSYLLAPLLALQVLLSLPLPRRPTLGEAGAFVLGGVLGAWPLLLILALDAGALTRHSVTEDPSSTLGNLAQGTGAAGELLLRTWRNNLPGAFGDYWGDGRPAGAAWGDKGFEAIAYKLAILGPLALLLLVPGERDGARRRLLLLCALGPLLSYVFLGWASPWKPHIRERYLIPALFLGWSAPALMVGAAVRTSGLGRGLGIVLGVLPLLWLTPPRLREGLDALHWERHDELLRARTVAWYNLGIATVWAEQVDEVNDVLDVRAADSDRHAWDGVEMGLGGGAPVENLGLAKGTWNPPAVGWPEMRRGVREWRERRSYQEEGAKDDPVRAGHNFGWGVGIRTRWDLAAAVAVWEEARGSDRWAVEVPWEAVWEGWGFGLARAGRGLPVAWPEGLPVVLVEAARTGHGKGLALGKVPKMGMPPPFLSIRGPAT